MNEATSFLQLVVTAMVPFILAAQGTMIAGRAMDCRVTDRRGIHRGVCAGAQRGARW